jgi:uncharacterized membrane protein YdjX (TVP38/TMEM64 family)
MSAPAAGADVTPADGDPTRTPTPRRSGPTASGRRRRLWTGALLVAALLLVGLGVVTFSTNPVIAEYRELVRFYSSKKTLRGFVTSFGPYAPLAFVGIQALQVVLAPIPGELTGILGGYVFGTWVGFAYSTVGLTLGSALAFLLGRRLGLPVVRRFVSAGTYRKFDFVSRAGGELGVLLCFLIPGFPKLPFRTFLVLSTLGRLPGTWLLSIQGAKVRSAQYADLILYLLIAAAALAGAFLYRDRLYQWMRAQHLAKQTDSDNRPTRPSE